MNKHLYQGFSLIHLMAAIAILGILSAIVYPGYQSYVRDARIRQAQSKLLDNARALEQFYIRNHSFRQNSTTWAALPITATEHFCIRFQGNPRAVRPADAEKFTLKAVAFDADKEPRVIRINESHTLSICETSRSRCTDNAAFFSGASGTDKNCRVVQ